MHKKIFILLYIYSTFIFSEDLKQEPLLVVVLMVKNEEKVIIPTLEPYVRAGINSYLIFDTGSTDNTILTVQDFFKQNNVNNFYIEEEPFIDFAISRNRALDLAHEKFPNAVFMLMPDAEWYVNNVKGLLNFCQSHINDVNNKTYLIKINSNINFYTPRLIRCHSNVKFAGAVHEVPLPAGNEKVEDSVNFDLGVSKLGYEKSKKRWERDLVILQKKYDENPNDSRSAFYLAQTYECLGDLKSAYKYYQLRSKLPGWNEENYETFYRLGNIAKILSKVDKSITWETSFDYYTSACKILPHRAEPLIKIAEHYWPDNIPLCYLFARRAMDLKYPKDDMLFVDREVYDYTINDMLSKSAWHVGEFDIGETATLNAIKAKTPHLHNNLMCYLESKKRILQQHFEKGK